MKEAAETTSLHVAVKPASNRVQAKYAPRKEPRSAGTSSRVPSTRTIGICIVVLQALWALAVPIKNVAMITKPNFRMDSIESEKTEYHYHSTESNVMRVPGSDVLPLLRSVVQIVLRNENARKALQQARTFDLDAIVQFLAPSEFFVLSKYYALVLQGSEFPGGILTKRPRSEALPVWIRNASTEEDQLYHVWCDSSASQLHGMKCMANDEGCVGFPKPNETRAYEFVDFTSVYQDSGLQSNVGLLFVIESFHKSLSTLFDTQNWRKTLELMKFSVDQDTNHALKAGSPAARKENQPYVLDSSAGTFGIRLKSMQTRALDSCMASELVMSHFFTHSLVLELIQQELRDYAISMGRFNDTAMYKPFAANHTAPANTQEILGPMFENYEIVLTSGARGLGLERTETRILSNTILTSITNATMRFKLDRKMNGETMFGSSLRMIQYMTLYPEYASYLNQSIVPSTDSKTGLLSPTDVHTYYVLGAQTSGLNTFKDDWWANTMQVYRLAEIPEDRTDLVREVQKYWDDEALIAQWFADLERSNDAPFYLLDQYVDIEPIGLVSDDNSTTRCHRAFFKTLARAVFGGLIDLSATSAYLLFMSNTEGGLCPWAENMVHKNELYGEILVGKKYGFSYTMHPDDRKDDGSAWVLIPVLHGMLQTFTLEEIEEAFLDGYSHFVPQMMSTESGNIHFLDSFHCQVGHDKAEVLQHDDTQEITEKLLPAVTAFFHDLIDQIPQLHARMQQELLAQHNITLPIIPSVIFTGTSTLPSGYGESGSPKYWQPTALTAGLLKLWPMRTPPLRVIQEYRNATRCYRTLELRYLNESIRCWLEPDSIQVSRVAFKSEFLRNLVFSNWAISLVLNCMAIVIAIEFTWRLFQAWRITKFQCVNVWVALQLNFQGFGILTFSQSFLLAVSGIPLLFSCHIPVNPTFMPDASTEVYQKPIKAILVALCSTWFIRVGYESVNFFLSSNQVTYGFRKQGLRAISVLIIFTMQYTMPERPEDTNYEFSKLLITIGVALFLGIGSGLWPVLQPLLQRRIRHDSKTRRRSLRDLAIAEKERNPVILALRQYHMPLNKHGLIGYSRQGWSLTGLLMEGWQLMHKHDTKKVVLRKGMCKIPLHVDGHGNLSCILKNDISPHLTNKFHYLGVVGSWPINWHCCIL